MMTREHFPAQALIAICDGVTTAFLASPEAGQQAAIEAQPAIQDWLAIAQTTRVANADLPTINPLRKLVHRHLRHVDAFNDPEVPLLRQGIRREDFTELAKAAHTAVGVTIPAQDAEPPPGESEADAPRDLPSASDIGKVDQIDVHARPEYTTFVRATHAARKNAAASLIPENNEGSGEARPHHQHKALPPARVPAGVGDFPAANLLQLARPIAAADAEIEAGLASDNQAVDDAADEAVVAMALEALPTLRTSLDTYREGRVPAAYQEPFDALMTTLALLVANLEDEDPGRDLDVWRFADLVTAATPLDGVWVCVDRTVPAEDLEEFDLRRLGRDARADRRRMQREEALNEPSAEEVAAEQAYWERTRRERDAVRLRERGERRQVYLAEQARRQEAERAAAKVALVLARPAALSLNDPNLAASIRDPAWQVDLSTITTSLVKPTADRSAQEALDGILMPTVGRWKPGLEDPPEQLNTPFGTLWLPSDGDVRLFPHATYAEQRGLRFITHALPAWDREIGLMDLNWRDFAPVAGQALDANLPDPADQAYLQRLYAATLSGLGHERVIVVFFGAEDTGRTTTLEPMLEAVGTYGMPVASSRLLRETSARDNLGDLRGRRMLTADLGGGGRRPVAGPLALLSSASRVPGGWQPQCVVYLRASVMPEMVNFDEIATRLRVIPFVQPHRPNEKVLLHIRQHELGGILLWGLQGVAAYRQLGLGNVPPNVATATAHVQFAGGDLLKNFVGLLEPASEPMPYAVLRARLHAICRVVRRPPPSDKALGAELKLRFVSERDGHNRERGYCCRFGHLGRSLVALSAPSA